MTSPADHHFFGPASYRKARPAPVSSGGFHSQRRRLGYSQPAPGDRPEAPNGDMTRRSEKEILQTLNDRFAGYIDKVRSMEMHNRNLEEEAAALRQSQAGRASIGEQYERELGDLRGLLQQLTGEKGGASMEREHLEEDVRHLRARLEDEARHREEVEAAARAMKKYVEECRRARLELDKKLRALEEEDAFLRRNHEEEVAELLAQIQGEQVSLDARDTLKADVTGALREIRAQLDSHACKSSTHAEEWFKVRIERLSDAARSNQDALRGSQGEISEYRRQLQSRTIELETLQGTKESLERQRMDSEDRHHDDLSSLQETINQLDNELKATKWEMASQLRDYQELLNVKMALDIEIAAYRKLLEGEENRFVSGGSPYSYLESRISTLFRVKGDEISDTVIVEEQTDETQVTEEEEEEEEEGEEEEEEGDKKVEQEEAGEDEEETKEDEAEGEEGEEKAEEGEGKEERAGNKGEGEEKGEEEDASEEKGKSPGKSPQPKSPVKSPESKSPAVKSPVSKSPPSKSPESKSPPKTPENEKAKPVVPRETPKEEKEEKPQPVKEETKEKEKPVKEEKNQEPKEKTTTDKPDTKKEREANEAPKTDDTSKPAAPTKPAEDKPAPKPEPKESSTPATEEKPSAPKPEKAESKPKPAPEVKEEKKEDKKPEEKSTSKAKPESAESKRDEKKPGEKKETSKEESKQVKEGGKAEKSSESKEGKEEKVKK